MKTIPAALLLLMMLAACSSPATPADGEATGVDTGTGAIKDDDQKELSALKRIGDVRVYWLQKKALVESVKDTGGHGGKFIEQPRQVHVLINNGHSFYSGITDYSMRPEERFLNSTDMHDLLVILRDQLGFFEKGISVNIKGDDPIARADSDDRVVKMIAVQQIKDGKVNTSYFARYHKEEADESKFKRVETFNKCLAFVMQATAGAKPRGSTGVGKDGGRSVRTGNQR